MVKPSDKLDKVCSHPPVPPPEKTAAKCALCMKPLAKEHMVTREGKSFCCDAAADQYFESDAQVQDVMGRQKKGGLLKKIIVLIILAAIAYGGYYWYSHRDDGSLSLDNLKNKVNELAPK